MRVFSKYAFVIGNRSFLEVLEIVDAFLKTNGLSYQHMGYHIADHDESKETKVSIAKSKRLIPNRKSATVSDMHDLLADYPQLGSFQTVCEKGMREIVLTNMDCTGQYMPFSCEEDPLREIAGKYPIPYYVSFLLLSYLNVNFFGKEWKPVGESCSSLPYYRINRKGSHITISKFQEASIKLHMMVEISEESEQADAYAQSMSALLGKKYTSETVMLMTPEEEAGYRQLRESAQDRVDAVNAALVELRKQYPIPTLRDSMEPFGDSFSVPKSLKRIGKKYGFTKYRYDFYNVFFLSKYTKEGHLLTFVVDSPPGFHELRLSVHLTGLGFQHRFTMGDFSAKNQEIADQLMQVSFEIIRQLEQKSMAELSAHYLQTPAWFMPNEWMLKTP